VYLGGVVHGSLSVEWCWVMVSCFVSLFCCSKVKEMQLMRCRSGSVHVMRWHPLKNFMFLL
jgi:hypothetical protein